MQDCRFEPVKRFADAGLDLPTRATEHSAGYDMAAAEDVTIMPYSYLYMEIATNSKNYSYNLDEMSELVKQSSAKFNLVTTGMKCKLPEGYYLKLVPRSSLPLKHWLVMANSEGIIDGDYYSNPDNDGEIMIQLINLSPCPIHIKKGDRIAQGIITPYEKTELDNATAKRVGGHGSTGER